MDFLVVDIFKQQATGERQEQEKYLKKIYHRNNQGYSLGKKLCGPINSDKKEIDYNEERQELTITIPRIIEQTKRIDEDDKQ